MGVSGDEVIGEDGGGEDEGEDDDDGGDRERGERRAVGSGGSAGPTQFVGSGGGADADGHVIGDAVGVVVEVVGTCSEPLRSRLPVRSHSCIVCPTPQKKIKKSKNRSTGPTMISLSHSSCSDPKLYIIFPFSVSTLASIFSFNE